VRSSRRERPSRTRLARWTRKSTIERPDDWGGETVRAADHSRARRAVGGHDRPARGSGGSGFKSRRPDLMSCCSQAVPAMRPAIFVGRVRFKVPPTAGPGDLLRSQRDHGTDTRRSRRWNPAGQPHRAPLAPPATSSCCWLRYWAPSRPHGRTVPMLPCASPDVIADRPEETVGQRSGAPSSSSLYQPFAASAHLTSLSGLLANLPAGPCNPVALASVGGASSQCPPWRPECRFSSASFRQTPRNQRTGCVSAWNAECP
jgi:hypothetical protein